MESNITLAISNIFVGILLIALSIPLVKRQIPMNHSYGVRVKKAFESKENWYKINEYGGKQLIGWSIPLVLLGVATFFIPLDEEGIIIPLIACAPLIVLVPAFMSIIYAKKL